MKPIPIQRKKILGIGIPRNGLAFAAMSQLWQLGVFGDLLLENSLKSGSKPLKPPVTLKSLLKSW